MSDGNAGTASALSISLPSVHARRQSSASTLALSSPPLQAPLLRSPTNRRMSRSQQQRHSVDTQSSFGSASSLGGSWVPFSNHVGAQLLLPGPNGGGAVGLPNFVPLGHPVLPATTHDARHTHGSVELEHLLAGSGTAVSYGTAGIGLEGRPYVSAAERNKAESRNVSEATMLLAALARDAAQHGTPRTIEKHNTTLTQLRVFAAGGTTSSLAKGGLHGPGGPHAPKSMPTFDVEKFMRTNQRSMSEQDRLSAADVLRIDPSDRSPAHIATLAQFLSSVSFFANTNPSSSSSSSASSPSASPANSSLLSSLARVATLRSLRRGEIVYAEGDEAVHMYVVLAGSVGTRVRDLTAPASSSSSSSSASAQSISASAAGGADAAGSSGGGGGSFVALTSSVGDLFGAETLGSGSGSGSGAGAVTGSATSAAKGECVPVRPQTKVALDMRTELLQVDMREYAQLLRASLTTDAATKLNFVSSLPMFARCTLREIERVSSVLTWVRVEKNQLVFKQGDMVNSASSSSSSSSSAAGSESKPASGGGGGMYFIVQGQVRVVHKVYSSVRVEEPPSFKPYHERAAEERYESSSETRRRRTARGGSPTTRRAATAEAKESTSSSSSMTAAAAAAAASSSGAVVSPASHSRSASMAMTMANTAAPAAGEHRRKGSQPSATFNAHRERTNMEGGGGGGHRHDWMASTHDSLPPPPTTAGPPRPYTSSSSTVRTILQPQLLDLGRLGPRWFFGELGVLRDEPRSASVYAETPCDLLMLSKEDVFARLPPSCIRFLRDYAQHFYAPPDQIKEQWKQQQRWDAFKQKMLQKQRRTPNVAESAAGFSRTLKY